MIGGLLLIISLLLQIFFFKLIHVVELILVEVVSALDELFTRLLELAIAVISQVLVNLHHCSWVRLLW